MKNKNSNSLFFIKSDILHFHLTTIINNIDDSTNNLNVNVSDTLVGKTHGVKDKYLWKISM